MHLQSGSSLGSYEIVSPLGAGGMGEVYRARDTKLDRDVAIKVLPEGFAADEERLARFEREAKSLAALNHPNIATVHGFERDGDIRFLVMELVEGEELSERIARGPIPVDEAIPLFIQIAEGLEAAHEKGIIHRDLKPANVKVTDQGRVKILDFGLAKATEPAPFVSGDLTQSPTLTAAATLRGEIMGTAAYMAPEQAQGGAVDHRADIWAFGACLFEALTGRRVFAGDNPSLLLAAVLKDAPDWTSIERSTPPWLARLLRRCLEKDPRRRFHHIADVRLELDDGPAQSPPVAGNPGGNRSTRWKSAAAIAFAAAIVGWGVALLWSRSSGEPTTRPRVSRFALELSDDQRLGLDMDTTQMAISRDGSRIAWIAHAAPQRRIFTRKLDGLEVVAIPGTEGVANLHLGLSPDGEHVLFARDGSLWRMPIQGGIPVQLLEGESPTSIWYFDWGEDNTIVVSQAQSGLVLVSAQGGKVEKVTEIDHAGGESYHLFPRFAAGGKHLLFGVQPGGLGLARIRWAVMELATGRRTEVFERVTEMRYLPTGHLVFARDGTLVVAPFDVETLSVTGDETPVLSGVQLASLGVAQFVASDEGTLLYVPEQKLRTSTLVWGNASGGLEPIGDLPPRVYWDPRLSPDGTRVAVTGELGIARYVFSYDLRNGVEERLTREGVFAAAPVWYPAGDALAFAAAPGPRSMTEGGAQRIFRQSLSGGGAEEEIFAGSPRHSYWPLDWSADGRYLLIQDRHPNDVMDLYLLPFTDGRAGEPIPVATGEANQGEARFSPDGRWVAFVSDESGAPEVVLQQLSVEGRSVGRQRRVSSAGGWHPRWSSAGTRIYYQSRNGRQLRSRTLELSPELRLLGEEVVLEGLPIGEPTWLAIGSIFDVPADGDQFLLSLPTSDSDRMTMVVVRNWFDELERLVPTGR